MRTMNLANQFLVAMPGLTDPNFQQTVTLVCMHNEQGAMGIIINRPLEITLKSVFDQMQIEGVNDGIDAQPIYEGGPVHRDHGFILHRSTGDWDSTLRVSDTLAVSTSRDILEAISGGNGPSASLIALGYANWGAGQLEEEMTTDAWLTAPVDDAIIFELPPELRWRAAVTQLGFDPANMIAQSGHA